MDNDTANILDGSNSSAIDQAVAALRRDSLVAIPTETVYGLAARASSSVAVKKIFTVKGRPSTHPLILHISKTDDLNKWSQNLSSVAIALIDRYWPGPLTIIVQRSNNVCDEITGGRDTVAVRCPKHKVTTELLTRLDDAIVAPSANRFGKVSPTTAQHVATDFGDEVEIVLDGGECAIGLESTIIDCTTDPAQLLRSGAITVEQIQSECKILIGGASGESRAPGMLDKHYSPNCKVELCATLSDARSRLAELNQLGITTEVLDFGDDLERYAHSLYARLRDADRRQIDVLIAVKPAMIGIGIAINERLSKASIAQ